MINAMTPNSFDPKLKKSKRLKERAQIQRRFKGVFIKSALLEPNEVRVLNISETGIGIPALALTPKAKEARTLEATLYVGNTVVPVTLRLTRASSQTAGFEFVDHSDLLKAAIRVFFEAELSGSYLKTKSQESTEFESKLHCFIDPKGNLLEFKINKNQKIQKFVITIFGNQVEWSLKKPELKLIQNKKENPVGSYLRSQLVQFIRNSQILDPPIRKQLELILLGIY